MPFSGSIKKDHDTIQVIGLGQACIDYQGLLSSYPQEDSKVELTGLHMGCGGPASTALVTLSRLGIRTSFIGVLSNDRFGMDIIRNLKEEKVDISGVKIVPNHTSQFSFIAISARGGKRTVFWHRGNVPPVSPEDVDLNPFRNARILHVDGLMVKASIRAAEQARQMGMSVVMDAGTIREGTKELVGFVDVLIASETFAFPIVGTGAPPRIALEALRNWGPEQVVITLGAKGCVGLSDEGFIRQEAFPVVAKDTTGAGDVYHGAYIYGLLEGWDMSRCMRFASAASALKCKDIGAQTAIPDLETILEFMGE